ncbi:MAG: hypothetical protein GC137_02675 [Alphaproteobacteria bacterium]|nr:hypothetical protein [Alphaproteobacteria bacterium]
MARKIEQKEAARIVEAGLGTPHDWWLLGCAYFYGDEVREGIPQDRLEGMKWFKKAAEAGSIDGITSLYKCATDYSHPLRDHDPSDYDPNEAMEIAKYESIAVRIAKGFDIDPENPPPNQGDDPNMAPGADDDLPDPWDIPSGPTLIRT